jgi:hypothetical protein
MGTKIMDNAAPQTRDSKRMIILELPD